ncbi:MAG: zinc-binding dehydrogenase [Pseudomonadota bacterium]
MSFNKTMRALEFDKHGGVDDLQLREIPTPQPAAYEVLVKVNAASLNGFDPMILQGSTELKTPFPMVPGGDFAGEIVALGERAGEPDPDAPEFLSLFDADRWKVGDRVAPFPFVMGEGMTGETRRGALCEYITMPVSNLIPIPDNVSDEDAASLPIAYGTAYKMMYNVAKVRSRENVLILGATGGVGTCAVQLAKAAGANVIAAGRGDWKVQKLKEIGADHVIDTANEDVIAACRDIVGKPRMMVPGRGVDLVINYIGGDTWSTSLKVIGHGGRMVTCGASAGYLSETDLRYLWTYELQLLGSNGWTPGDQMLLFGMVSRGELKPIIQDVRSLADAPAAIQDLIDRNVFGKIVIKP